MPIGELFQKFDAHFAELNSRAVKPIEQVAKAVFREANQQALLQGELNDAKNNYSERCKRAQEEKEFELLNGAEKKETPPVTFAQSFIAVSRIKELPPSNHGPHGICSRMVSFPPIW